jgi:hypothetical protein
MSKELTLVELENRTELAAAGIIDSITVNC